MKTMYRDLLSIALAILGAVVMFAKLSSYSWVLIGSWAGALGVLAVIGLAIFLVNSFELFKLSDNIAIIEFTLWMAAAVVITSSLASTTTKAEFIASGALIGASWLVQMGRDWWRSLHSAKVHVLHAK